jgi:hypothetical protein
MLRVHTSYKKGKGATFMANQEPTRSQKSSEGYRGVLIYRQECGCKLVTMMITLRTPGEQSHIAIWSHDLDTLEDIEPLSVGSLHAAIDLYHFRITGSAEIELAIKNQEGEYTAYYTVNTTRVEEYSSFLWLDIVKFCNKIRLHDPLVS